jgi:hypothetical protein
MTSPFPPVPDLAELDVRQTLTAAGRARDERHAAEVFALRVDQHWAALHGHEPPPRPAAPLPGMTRDEWERGFPRLVRVGGDGTPAVQDLPICELAIARGVHSTAARAHLADALDLDHRLPHYWAELQAGRGEVWVARKIATMSRHLDRSRVPIVDAAVTLAIDESPGRLLAIAEAAVLRADPEQARERAEERARRRYVALGRSDETGLRKVFALIDAGDAAWLDAMLERIAGALEARPDLLASQEPSRDELRAEALGWLAHPDDAIALLAGTYRLDDRTAADPSSSRQPAMLFLHLAQDAVRGRQGVARVEGLGPLLLDEVQGLLRHANVVVRPVIDLNEGRSVNGYEHPGDVKERGFLRSTGDVFPHAQSQSRRVDNDHPDPYREHGPPGQTGDHNHAPLGRQHHRAKTHLGYQVHQLGLGVYLWRTPHGLWRLVDGTGTHEVQAG